jgi:hypothetical protein
MCTPDNTLLLNVNFSQFEHMLKHTFTHNIAINPPPPHTTKYAHPTTLFYSPTTSPTTNTLIHSELCNNLKTIRPLYCHKTFHYASKYPKGPLTVSFQPMMHYIIDMSRFICLPIMLMDEWKHHFESIFVNTKMH